MDGPACEKRVAFGIHANAASYRILDKVSDLPEVRTGEFSSVSAAWTCRPHDAWNQAAIACGTVTLSGNRRAVRSIIWLTL